MKRAETWEEVKRDMRKATRLSKQAILLAHQERNDDAKELLDEAYELLSKLDQVSQEHPDLIHRGIVHSAFQEYTEAHTFLSLIEEDRFINPEELEVPFISYILGLADVVGEFRRRALDALRKRSLETAEECLQIMENIYTQLTGMEEGYHLASGLRRKCDIARRIIESTRGDVTIEARRSSLERSIKKLERSIRDKEKD
ncbi:MAG: translin family protein [Desulfobacterales bacterium]|nr:translin family protein [Desulfobacterales bacterium]NIW15983.1 translin family protein [Candidatus Bathyarchaeota archaeon]